MINMIKSELYRITKSKGIWIFWIVAALNYAISIIFKQEGGLMLGTAPEAVYADNIKMDISQVGMNFTFYFLLLIPVFGVITAEFSEHTVKNSISSSISKNMFFISKYVFALVYSLISFTAANYLFYIINRLVNGDKYSSPIADFSKAFFTQLPLFVMTVSVFILLAFLLRKGAAFNAVTIIFPFAYSMVMQILESIKSTKKAGDALAKIELSSMMFRLALDPSDSYRNKCYILCAVVIVISFVLGYLSFTKSELD